MLKKILCGATLLCAAGFTSAATIEDTAIVPQQLTDYDTVVSMDLFDDMGGTLVLQSVTFSIDGSIFGSAAVENLGASNQTVDTTLSAELTLTDALMNTLVVTIPTISNSFDATAFDGTIDFDGTSGITYPELSANQYEEETYTDAATLAFFTGMGTADFGFDAAATSRAVGGGNLITQFRTEASGIVKVVYEYTRVPVNVSSPSQVAFLGLGLLAFAGLRKVRN